ncbi:MAG: UDP-N-acetylglucosamine--N-acetylmuramyl-(pentapeptide) pyrophosphoryl-undecaprenol N-acetylglucosamine transferase [Chitinophagaceae bacterium]|nr:UDP-N-acetylglucosamine--N-acetylmuramyl-(pentapeptide) pyrophosphoryl-undecaprenol N-acetylglucosamine transferase [Chitinophagaceae bacterium]
MTGQKNIRVLLAPLDWGLGHATRCVPLVRLLQELGCEVVLAADGAVAALLSNEFPGITIKQLKGYGIRYSSGSSLAASMLRQLPRIFSSIRYEHKWLDKVLGQETFHLIISDNRPGFYSKHVPSVYITHQLLIHSGKGAWMNRLLQQLHHRYIKQFTSVWVPDMQAQPNLAGELSHPAKPLVQPVYLGLLSRMQPVRSEISYDLLVMLSGPEPQRTMLEEKLLSQLSSINKTVLFIRGLPAHDEAVLQLPPHITVHHHLPAAALQQAIASSQLVICRSGYTTLMDLVRLNKKAVLIPTPGQPEQEYLARYMQEQQLFPVLLQNEVSIAKAIDVSSSFPYQQLFTVADFERYKLKIAEQIGQLNP